MNITKSNTMKTPVMGVAMTLILDAGATAAFAGQGSDDVVGHVRHTGTDDMVGQVHSDVVGHLGHSSTDNMLCLAKHGADDANGHL